MIRFAIVVTLALVMSNGQIQAGVVYNNFTTNSGGYYGDSIGTYHVNGGGSVPNSVSDSFTVTGATTLTYAIVELWVASGSQPTSLTWSIGTSAFGSDTSPSSNVSLTNLNKVGTGTGVDLVNGTTNNITYDIYTAQFNLTGSLIANATYYLTLSGGASVGSSNLLWDVSGGASTSSKQSGGTQSPDQPSHSFELFGPDAGGGGSSASAVPEPASMSLLAAGALGMLGYRLRRRNAPAIGA